MEQIQQLLDLLKETPEMALWGLVIWCLFILLKLSSWILALKIVAQQFIKRYFNYKDKKSSEKLLLKETEVSLQNAKNESLLIKDWNRSIDKKIIRDASPTLLELLNELVNLKTSINTPYVHEGDMRKAIEIIKEYKSKK